jgi:hypothetical protein
MQKANPIRRRRSGWGYGQGKARALRAWLAACPICNKEIGGLRSRKQAKDALYRHTQKQHKPGLVGR